MTDYEPKTWEDVVRLAESDDPRARAAAYMAVANDPRASEAIKRAYLDNWAEIDPAGAAEFKTEFAAETSWMASLNRKQRRRMGIRGRVDA